MILDEIMASKRAELEGVKERVPLETLVEKLSGLDETRDFAAALKADGVRIIAEVKKASPSKGVIREDFDPVAIAKAYDANGAAAISVLTEMEYFMGSLDYMNLVKASVKIPVLRKDFIFDYYQLVEARVNGADAVLLIAAVLEAETLISLIEKSKELGLAQLVEVHSDLELEKAKSSGAEIIGINNRNLKTFKTDIETTKRLMEKVPDSAITVSESGINTGEDIRGLTEAGVDAFLIGEALMRDPDVGAKLRSFVEAS
jgi:indole-3-glycerol phosphate synthase